MKRKTFKEKYIYDFFEISIITKGLISLFEIFSGLTFLLTPNQSIFKFMHFLTHSELSEDPKDIVANYLIHSAQNLSISTQHFIGLYLLVYGLIKCFLIFGLIEKKIWSYPFAIIIFSFFCFYQILKFFDTYSLLLLILIIIDIIVIILTWHEYKLIKKQHLKI